MNIATLILTILAAIMFIYAWRQEDGSHWQGVQAGAKTLRQTAPIILIAFALTGLVTVLSPEELITRWIGPESGLSGILAGEGVGMLLPGGPYVIFPLVKVIYENGAGVAQVITIITGWAALGLLRLAFEVPFMGWRFSVVRLGLAAFAPLVAGIVALIFFNGP